MALRSLFDPKAKGAVSPHEVKQAYQLFFRRTPESAEIIQQHVRSHKDVWSLLASLMQSPEFSSDGNCNPRTSVDWKALLKRYQQAGLVHRRGYITNFLGVETDVTFLRHLSGSPGFVEGLPIPGSFHCSTAEWIAGLRGVELSGDDFVVVELGAGWGPWMVDLARAARIRGAKRTFAVGCEADELHLKFISQHLACNGFQANEYSIYQGAIGPKKGHALFPISEDSSNDWGLRPLFCDSEREADAIVANPKAHADYRGVSFRRFDKVRCHTLADVLVGLDHVDVMHVDIQGGEFELLRGNLDLLKRATRYLVIGTHGRQIEGELIGLLAGAGWKLEVEEPCAFDISHKNLAVQVDGTQGWRNLDFALPR